MSDALQNLIRQAEAQKLQIETDLLYQKNLSLFQERFPDIHKLVKEHKPNTIVLHLDPNGHLNLADKVQRTYVYNRSPMEISREQVDLFEREAKMRRFRIASSVKYNDRHLHIPYVNAMLDEYQKTSPQRLSTVPTLLTSLIVSGIGLGYHFLELINRFNIQHIFIYENCVDTFHASLHTVNWKPILDYFRQEDRSITFCIGVTPEKALAQMEYFINHYGLFSQMFTFAFCHSNRESDKQFISTYSKEIKTYLGGIGFYDDEQIGLAHAYHNLQSGNAVFYHEKVYKRSTRIIIVGNGPSLDAHEEYLRNSASNAIIMSCGTSLGSLLRMGIKPDFHVESERTQSMNDFLDFGTTAESRKGITLLCLHTVSPVTIASFEEACYAIKPNDAGASLIHEYYKPQKIQELAFCNPTVTNCGLAFAIYMGFCNIHFVGIDLGLPVEGQHHSKHSLHFDMEGHVEEDTSFNYDYEDNNNIYREGNFGGKIKTHHVLDSSRLSMERLIELATKSFPELRCVNSNNGVKIKLTDPIAIEDIPPLPKCDKQAVLRSLKENHFLRRSNDTLIKNAEAFALSHIFKHEQEFYLAESIEDDMALMHEFSRIYRLARRQESEVTHFLLRGSMNTFFGAITENSLYCVDRDAFKQQVQIGITAYNGFIRHVFKQLHEEPFRTDDTENPIIAKMKSSQKA